MESRPPIKSSSRSGYIRTLDGWRTIAVFGVIWYHGAVTSIRPLQSLQEFGEEGVYLFFAISGILICSRLLEEQRAHGSISLKGFYIRRLCRIQPAAIVYLLFLVVLAALGVLHIGRGALISSLLSYRNLYPTVGANILADDRFTFHFWSLAVEEHFYLFLPALMVVARRKLVAVLGLVTALSLVWPPIVHRVRFLQSPELGWRTDVAVQSLLVPAFLAVLLTIPSFRRRLTQISSRGFLIFLLIGLLLVTQIFLKSYFTVQICCFGFPMMLISTVLHPENWFGRFLETKVLTTLGRMSYSLYLWQQIFISNADSLSVAGPLGYLREWPWNLVSLMFCATGSYFLIEKPFIRLGHRLAPPATSGRKDLHEQLASTRSA